MLYMGNSPSSNSNGNSDNSKKKITQNLPEVIDYLATQYILTQSFQDMVNLRDSKYCNDLVILTSDIISEYLNEQQIQYMYNNIKDGVDVNQLKEDSLLWIKRKNLENIDELSKIPKRKLCIGIAKRYVKIAHLFGAIVTTINPTYTYQDSLGKKVTVPLKDKYRIPSYTESKLERINICSERVNALINGKNFTSGENIVIQPNFCNLNVADQKDNPYHNNGETKLLIQEPGIPELQLLYHDEYDYENGKFMGMSDNMKKLYNSDVETFYKSFTGNSEKPEEVKEFSDIKLRDFKSSEGCKPDNVYTKSYEGSRSQNLFKEYAAHVQKMIQNAQQKQNALLFILEEIFVWNLDTIDEKKQISINPALTETKLDEIIAKARELIINCYITCENDFVKGLEIFESIVEKQIMTVTKSQIERLEKTIQDTLVKSPSNTNDSGQSNNPSNDSSEDNINSSNETNSDSSNPTQQNNSNQTEEPIQTEEPTQNEKLDDSKELDDSKQPDDSNQTFTSESGDEDETESPSVDPKKTTSLETSSLI